MVVVVSLCYYALILWLSVTRYYYMQHEELEHKGARVLLSLGTALLALFILSVPLLIYIIVELIRN